MKKTAIVILLLGITISNIHAQALKKDGNSVNIYYGINVFTSFYKSVADQSGVTGVKVSGMGPVGIVYEHMMTDNIGLGGEIGYAKTTVEYKDSYDPTSAILYDYRYNFTTIRAQLRLNLHFAKSENFDAYMLFNAGYRNMSATFESNDPLAIEESVSSFVPIGIKIGLGIRYFFTDNIGIHTEIALGSPLIGGGLSFKF